VRAATIAAAIALLCLPPLAAAASEIVDLSLESAYMARKMPCKVYLPTGYGDGGRYPVLYALNGHGSNQSMWIDAGLAACADELIAAGRIEPLIIVFPYTRDSTLEELEWQLKEEGTLGERNIDRFIAKELAPAVDSRFDTIRSAKGRYIGGFSMGGAIALRVALRHPELFGKAGGCSPALTFGDYSGDELERWLFPGEGGKARLEAPRVDAASGLGELAVYLDAGTVGDPFLERTQSLCAALLARGIAAEFHPYEGGHSLRHAKGDFRPLLAFYAARE
jgi:enterochelin esterase-like enzyme